MPTYPEKVAERGLRPKRIGVMNGENVSGKAVNFDCGSMVRFSLSIDDARQQITDVRFKSNGCGYMVAAAETLALDLKGRELRQLHGLDEQEFNILLEDNIGAIPLNRESCIHSVRESLLSAFAEYRKQQIEEFAGEKALICTCFGVSEETIERFIGAVPKGLDDVMKACRAGTGCGSCRMLIQEMIDEARTPAIIE